MRNSLFVSTIINDTLFVIPTDKHSVSFITHKVNLHVITEYFKGGLPGPPRARFKRRINQQPHVKIHRPVVSLPDYVVQNPVPNHVLITVVGRHLQLQNVMSLGGYKQRVNRRRRQEILPVIHEALDSVEVHIELMVPVLNRDVGVPVGREMGHGGVEIRNSQRFEFEDRGFWA